MMIFLLLCYRLRDRGRVYTRCVIAFVSRHRTAVRASVCTRVYVCVCLRDLQAAMNSTHRRIMIKIEFFN